MSKIILPYTFFVLLFYNLAAAQDRGFGVGIIVGEPTGISLKKRRWTYFLKLSRSSI